MRFFKLSLGWLGAMLVVWFVLHAFGGTARGAECHTAACAPVKVQVQKHVAAVVVHHGHDYYPQQYGIVAPWLQEQAAFRYALKSHEGQQLILEAVEKVLGQTSEVRGQGPEKDADEANAETATPPVFSSRQSVMAASCIRCHGGEAPKAGLSLDVELADETRAMVARAVLTEKMPPKNPLTNEAKSRLILELFSEE